MSIAARTSRSPLKTLLQHNQNVVFNRYDTVRRFFLKQAVTLPSTSSSVLRTSIATYGFHPYGSHRTIFLGTGAIYQQSWRGFHFSSGRAEEKKTEGPSSMLADKTDGGGGSEVESQKPPIPPTDYSYQFENYSRFFRGLALRLPHMHRPTRDDFLNAASGFWQRLRVRFKWITIRSFRKYNADDISAFVSWFIMSQTLWLFVGT